MAKKIVKSRNGVLHVGSPANCNQHMHTITIATLETWAEVQAYKADRPYATYCRHCFGNA